MKRNSIIWTLCGAVLAGCASLPSATLPSGPPEAIEVVYRPDVMFYSVENGGRGRFRVSDREDYVFESTPDTYARVAALLAPLRDGGNPCPSQLTSDPPGHIRWTRGDDVHEVPLTTTCNDPAHIQRSIHSNQAFRYVYDLAERAPQPGHPPLPAPSQIKLVWMTWGNVREEWTIPAGGTAHWRQPPDGDKDFSVSAADFERVRAQFRAFEGMAFRCERTVYDMPYGKVVWSQDGLPDQTLEFDLGCVTGDADAVLESVEKATAVMVQMRDRIG